MTAAPRISAVVMTHPSRRDAADRLAKEYPDLGLTVVTDPEPGAPGGTLRTSRLAWSRVEAGATHHLVVQDDSILTTAFAAHLDTAVRHLPRHALGLFTEWGSRTSYALRVAALAGAGWVEVVDVYMPAQVLVLPADVAREFAVYAGRTATGAEPDDVALFDFLRPLGTPMLVSVPNLAEHGDLPSVAGNDQRHGLRKSACWPGEDTPPPTPVVFSGFSTVAYFSWYDGTANCLRRDPSGNGAWERLPTTDLLRYRGLDPEEIDRMLVDARAAVDATTDVPEHLLRGVLVSALALGLVAAEHGAVAASDPTGYPPAAAAIDTLAPGGLRRFVAPHDLPEIRERLRPGVVTAIRLGMSRHGTVQDRHNFREVVVSDTL
jgi:hypothetical protein